MFRTSNRTVLGADRVKKTTNTGVTLASTRKALKQPPHPLLLPPICVGHARFGPTNANGYGLGYTIHDDLVTIPVTSFRTGHTDGKVLAEGIGKALRDIADACR